MITLWYFPSARASGRSGGTTSLVSYGRPEIFASRRIFGTGMRRTVSHSDVGRCAVSASGILRERDLRAMVAVLEDGLRDGPGEAMPWAVLERLREMIPCEQVAFKDFDLREQQLVFFQSFHGEDERIFKGNLADGWVPPYPEYWAHYPRFLPHNYRRRTGDVVSVLRWSDFYTATALRNDPHYTDYLGPCGDRYAVHIPLPTGPGRTRRLCLVRGSGPDFTDGDRLALQLLRPHLHQVYLDAEQRRRGIPHLSRREQEVLRLASQDYSNADIARLLFISVGTVRKHMEHIFDRTGVRTRSDAAALALRQASPFGVALPLVKDENDRTKVCGNVNLPDL
jgi:DNA-binding CsgD family transcriptional regulator